MRAVYKSNRCYHIRAAIQAGPTLAALQPVREKILDQPTTDLSTVRFLDAIDTAVRAAFGLSQTRRARTGRRPGPDHPAAGLATPETGRLSQAHRPAASSAVSAASSYTRAAPAESHKKPLTTPPSAPPPPMHRPL